MRILAKIKCNLTLTPATKERLLQYAEDHHLTGGMSAAVEQLIWNAKVSKSQIKGQENIDSFLKSK